MPAAKPTFPRLRKSFPLAQGLTGAWFLYEGNGTIANDVADQSSTGSAGEGGYGTFAGTTGVPTWTAGQFGYCLKFTAGNAQYVNLPIAPFNLAAATSQITIAGWINVTATDTPLVCGRNSGNGGNTVFDFVVGSNGLNNSGTGKLSVLVRDNSGVGLQTVNGVTAVNDGKWHHCILTRSAAQLLSLYLDGNLDASGTDTMANPCTFTDVRWFGESINSSVGNGSAGLADSLVVFSRALSRAEIAQLYEDTFDMVRHRSWRLKGAAVAARQQTLTLLGCGV